jgi:glycosyltransferase involved in cell wall biosynthesis
MKIACISYATQTPPKGWGAVEILNWEYSLFIAKNHPDVEFRIFNSSDEVNISEINDFVPDYVHIHTDGFHIVPQLKCSNIVVTSHWGYLDQIHIGHRDSDRWYAHLVYTTCQNSWKVFCLSSSIRDQYLRFGASPERLFIRPNGVNDEIFKFTDEPRWPDRSVYLARIESRKRQHLFQSIDSLYFVGPYENGPFDKTSERWLGEMTKHELHESLTDWGNLVLLSDGEAHALVVAEGLVCGLGVVVSEQASANLDISLPFIDVIPEERVNDLAYVESVILRNREVSVKMRVEIREWARSTFGWKNIVKGYLSDLQK